MTERGHQAHVEMAAPAASGDGHLPAPGLCAGSTPRSVSAALKGAEGRPGQGGVRFAYADPPYPGQAKRLYGKHADYAGEVDHAALIARLEAEFDCWALSTGSRMLQDVIALCPPVRVLAWVKPVAPPMGDGFHYGWEPVLLRGGRRPSPAIRDWVSVSPEAYAFRPRPASYVIGAKPGEFCRWLFAAAGLRPGDEFHDLFPGSGAVGRAWESWRSQLSFGAEGMTDRFTVGDAIRGAGTPTPNLPYMVPSLDINGCPVDLEVGEVELEGARHFRGVVVAIHPVDRPPEGDSPEAP